MGLPRFCGEGALKCWAVPKNSSSPSSLEDTLVRLALFTVIEEKYFTWLMIKKLMLSVPLNTWIALMCGYNSSPVCSSQS